MKNPLIFLFLLVSTFAFSQNEKLETPKIAIKIPLGETVVIKDVSIKFLEVTEDSRCPEYVTCIWAGRAIVKVEVSVKGKNPQQKQLLFGATQVGETVDNVLYKSGDRVLEGLKLTPYPKESTSENMEYVLLVCEAS